MVVVGGARARQTSSDEPRPRKYDGTKQSSNTTKGQKGAALQKEDPSARLRL